ncbi:22391_t:CDS:2 [Entrophospora sp. SA101]|nr:10735_t:CDS:2 [Entrophospora sp. SA101]CAJ0749147.1 22391_t:CDS:2 [Entrophospora sp. SA101]CAJ0827569.1 11251_t:CDS:2 [Entrophospora sp. SA101]CAJ0906835.1 5723_t:CDS:2 [Entrophospora sp. SA101]CAJ0907216.1 2350_t:CDS:2 [Entrophospora sp. SA101]
MVSQMIIKIGLKKNINIFPLQSPNLKKQAAHPKNALGLEAALKEKLC